MKATAPPGVDSAEIVLDTSACVAVLRSEPAAERLLTALEAADACYMSAGTVIELGLVMTARFDDRVDREVDLLLHRLGATIVPVAIEHAELARSAYRRFGKGRHSAGLNFGDCFSYALAAALHLPLLFVGDDFAKTDLAIAKW